MTVLAEPLNVLVGDLTFTRPEKWLWTDLEQSTAVTRFIVPNERGKESLTDVRFYMTDRTPAQTLERWKSFFSPDQRNGQQERKTVGGREIITVTLRGDFTFPPFKVKRGYRFVGTMIPSGKQFVTVRLVGPDHDAENATDDFRKMVEEALTQSSDK